MYESLAAVAFPTQSKGKALKQSTSIGRKETYFRTNTHSSRITPGRGYPISRKAFCAVNITAATLDIDITYY